MQYRTHASMHYPVPVMDKLIISDLSIRHYGTGEPNLTTETAALVAFTSLYIRLVGNGKR